MTLSERAQRVAEIVKSALEHGPQDCAAFVEESCAGDEELRAEVASLLKEGEGISRFIEEPALHFAAETFVREGACAAGQLIGDYEILSLIARGGMGEVYLAQDRQLQRKVALKLVQRGMDSADLIRHFNREERLLASLNHPNIAQLYGGGVTADGIPYFAMEYVEGQRLDEHCAERQLSTDERLELFRKVCAAVSYAHRHLVIHRDLKPANIRVTPESEPKLLDFGIAKLLDPESSAGAEQTITLQGLMTPNYASPEQIRGEPMTTASDVYSLGVVLYELLTGQRPYRSTSRRPDEIARAITDQEPERPSAVIGGHQQSLKGDLDNILLKAIRKEPERRYPSVAQFSDDIQRHLQGLPVSARQDTFAYRASRFVGRNRFALAAAALILVTLVGGIVMTARERRKADRRFNDVRQLANSFLFEVDDAIQRGPTQARAILVRQALTYLDRLAQEAGNDAELQLELTAGYLKTGDVQGKPYRPNLGDSAGALASYRKAQELLQPLVATDPGNLEARRYLSVAWQSIGRLQGRMGDWTTALASQRKAVAISEGLVSAHPERAPYRSLLADNCLHLGEALYQEERGATMADHREAIAWFRKALAMHEALSAAQPANASYRYAAGVDYEYIGIVFNKLGDLTGDPENYRAALENHRTELRINKALAASDPANGTYRRILADVYGEVGFAQLKLEQTTEALENFRSKLAIFDSIRASDPTNVEAQRDVANSYDGIGQALAQSGDLSAALGPTGQAVAINQRLSKAEPANTETRLNLLRGLEALGELREKAGDVGGALENYQQALVVLEAWSKAEPGNVVIHRRRTTAEANVARIHQPMAVGRKITNE